MSENVIFSLLTKKNCLLDCFDSVVDWRFITKHWHCAPSGRRTVIRVRTIHICLAHAHSLSSRLFSTKPAFFVWIQKIIIRLSNNRACGIVVNGIFTTIKTKNWERKLKNQKSVFPANSTKNLSCNDYFKKIIFGILDGLTRNCNTVKSIFCESFVFVTLKHAYWSKTAFHSGEISHRFKFHFG